jgi:hypothetical protein
MEAESELTVTQLKEKRQTELAAREIEELEHQRREEERAKREEDQGIDWGMGEFRRIQLVRCKGHELHQAYEMEGASGGVLYWGT